MIGSVNRYRWGYRKVSGNLCFILTLLFHLTRGRLADLIVARALGISAKGIRIQNWFLTPLFTS
jgi:hypothetical protein